MKKLRTLCLLTAVSLTVVACHTIPYRIDIDQGNVITPQAVAKLQPGMTKQEVQRTLGSSLLTDIFHSNRWDYVQYYTSAKTGKRQESKVSLFFTSGLLTKVKAEEIAEIKTNDVPYGSLQQQ